MKVKGVLGFKRQASLRTADRQLVLPIAQWCANAAGHCLKEQNAEPAAGPASPSQLVACQLLGEEDSRPT